jgi:acyl carrier protein
VLAETAAVLSGKGAEVTAADLAASSTRTFKDLGFDSLMSVQLRNRLAKAAGVRLPAAVAFSYPTARTLGSHIFSLLEPEPPVRGTPEPDTPETVEETGSEIHSDDELYALIDHGYV